MGIDRTAMAAGFEAAIADLEAALRRCPDDRWEASVWVVERTDPWLWPKPGVQPIPERTVESLQVMSAVWAVAYHCLWFLDFYATLDSSTYDSPAFVKGGMEEMPWPEDGAAPLPDRTFDREVLLRFLDHGREKVRQVLAEATDEQLAAPLPAYHPHAGATVGELLEVNLAHVREHGGRLLAFVS